MEKRAEEGEKAKTGIASPEDDNDLNITEDYETGKPGEGDDKANLV